MSSSGTLGIPEYARARSVNGTYSVLGAQIKAMRGSALAIARYGHDFIRHIADSSEQGKPHYFYVRPDDHKQFTVNLFGEIRREGTAVSAKGTFWSHSRDQIITDTTNVRDRIVLGTPTGADPELHQLFHNQLAGLDEVLEEDAKYEDSIGEKFFPIEWVRDDGQSLTVKLPPKYEVPPEYKKTAPGPGTRSQVRRERVKRKAIGEDDQPSGSQSSNAGGEGEDASADLKAGALVDPHVLPDYGGPLFRHEHAQLVVQDIRRHDNDAVVHPGDWYDELRPGTLVMVNATLASWAMPPSTFSNGLRQRAYTINANSVKIISPSTEPVEQRDSQPQWMHGTTDTRPAPPASDDAKNTFESFSASPAKKQRTSITGKSVATKSAPNTRNNAKAKSTN